MKIMMYVNMIFFVGMTTFPGPFADGYKMDFSCPARPARGAPPCDEKKNTALLWFAFNLFGIQLGSLAGMAGALARDGVSKKAQSAFLFVTMISYPFLTISDLIATTTDDFTNSGTPKEGIYFNTVLFSALTVAIYLAWQGTGGYVPDVNKLVPTGRFSTVIINLVNGSSSRSHSCCSRDQFLEMFGMNEPLTNMGANKWIVMLIFGNIGKVLFWNCVAMLVVPRRGRDKGGVAVPADPRDLDLQHVLPRLLLEGCHRQQLHRLCRPDAHDHLRADVRHHLLHDEHLGRRGLHAQEEDVSKPGKEAAKRRALAERVFLQQLRSKSCQPQPHASHVYNNTMRTHNRPMIVIAVFFFVGREGKEVGCPQLCPVRCQRRV